MNCHPALPDYYLYEKDGRWYKTDDALTKAISSRIFANKTAQIPKMVFYPNWNAKGLSGAKYAAWRVNKFGEQVMRWYWRVGEHSKRCKNCIKLDNGRCAVKMVAMIEWNEQGHCWSLAKMPGRATDEEAEVLDKM